MRAFYQNVKGNATTIQIANSAPGLLAVSGGGYGPGSIQNYITAANQPLNSLTTPAAPGQVVTIWGTGLGPVTFPDNVAPSPGNVSTPVILTIGGQPANVAYSGCCAGVDQIVATIPANAPLGKGGTLEEVAAILGDNPATIRRYYAKWTEEYQSRQDTLIRKIHGTNLAQVEEQASN